MNLKADWILCMCVKGTYFLYNDQFTIYDKLKGSIRPREMFDNVVSFDLQHIVIIANRLMNTLYEIHLHQRRLIKAKRLSKKTMDFSSIIFQKGVVS